MYLPQKTTQNFVSIEGEEAQKVFNDAQRMLQTVQSTGCLRCRGVVGFWRANSVGDDIEIYNDNGVVVETLRGLRQQVHTSIIILVVQ